MDTDHDLDNEHINARKTAIIDTELIQRNVHIAALQETKLPDAGPIKEKNYTFFWFGNPDGEPRIHGTGFAVRNNFISSIQTPIAVSVRLSSLRLNIKQESILVISAYAPTLKSDPADKDMFYNQLEDLLKSSHEN